MRSGGGGGGGSMHFRLADHHHAACFRAPTFLLLPVSQYLLCNRISADDSRHGTHGHGRLRAAGALCDFEAGCDLRTKCLAAATAVAAGSSKAAGQVSDAVCAARCALGAGLHVFGCVVELSLTLMEGASVQGGSPAEVQTGILCVSGQRRWVHEDVRVVTPARVVAVLGAKLVICYTAQSLGNLRRKVVWAAASGCAPFTLPVQI